MASRKNSIATESLEPRVAKVETGLEMLTRDVASLAQVVREQGVNIERQIRELAVGVTQAAAPKKTDWSLLLSLLMFILALGSAVFWPINQTAQESKHAIQTIEQKYNEHVQLPIHPVAGAIFQSHVETSQKLEDARNKEWERNTRLLEERLNKLELSDQERNKEELAEYRALKARALNYHMDACPPLKGAK